MSQVRDVASKTTGSIHLIAGCFSNQSNANVLIAELKSKGVNSRILDKNKGLFRVAAGSYSSSAEAKSAKNNLSELSISTWILKK